MPLWDKGYCELSATKKRQTQEEPLPGSPENRTQSPVKVSTSPTLRTSQSYRGRRDGAKKPSSSPLSAMSSPQVCLQLATLEPLSLISSDGLNVCAYGLDCIQQHSLTFVDEDETS